MNKIYDVIHFALNEDVTNETDAFFSSQMADCGGLPQVVQVCVSRLKFAHFYIVVVVLINF